MLIQPKLCIINHQKIKKKKGKLVDENPDDDDDDNDNDNDDMEEDEEMK